MTAPFSRQQAKFFAHFLTREGMQDTDTLTQSLSSARVDLNPHQVDAAMFALRSPLSKGVLLADEVGLGKTIEAALDRDRAYRGCRDRTDAGTGAEAARRCDGGTGGLARTGAGSGDRYSRARWVDHQSTVTRRVVFHAARHQSHGASHWRASCAFSSTPS